jgi:integrase
MKNRLGSHGTYFEHAKTMLASIVLSRPLLSEFFGNCKLSAVTRQIAYSIYEQYVIAHGHDSANKAMSACKAAFGYGMLKFEEIAVNPFLRLHKFSPPPRRQRWTDAQLRAFTRKAEEMGYPSIGLCALLCMELVQRPGDILSLKWSAYEERHRTWHIRQTKCGAVVRVPETKRLRAALRSARRLAKTRANGDISGFFGLPDKNWKTLATAQFHWDGEANCGSGRIARRPSNS